MLHSGSMLSHSIQLSHLQAEEGNLYRVEQGSKIQIWGIFVSSKSHMHHHPVGRSVFTTGVLPAASPGRKKSPFPFPLSYPKIYFVDQVPNMTPRMVQATGTVHPLLK